jgi:transcriptional regulator with PAS, ATPase and Fis domain
LEEERIRLKEENLHLKSTIRDRFRFGPLVGKSQVMQQVYELLVNAAAAEVNVMVCGESGTGKELIARTLHQVSRRKTRPFVAVNCASIPETLFEREFFGHRKGAFTGADRNTPGLFDRAHQGTLFLDEVTELSPGTQAKLLRVLQDGEYTPLGSTIPKQADVVIVAATNRNCQKEIERERLRKDFFYRIGVIEIAVSPLRERKDDLALLIEHILEEYRQKQAHVQGNILPDLPTDQTMLPAELVQALYAYEWPGNIRELQNVLQRYLVTRDSGAVLALLGTHTASRAVSYAENLPPTLPEAVQTLEKRMITHTLTQTQNRIGKTAEKLGMPVRTLQYKIKKYQLLLKN